MRYSLDRLNIISQMGCFVKCFFEKNAIFIF